MSASGSRSPFVSPKTRSCLFLALWALSHLSGCATTKPWERENLAQPEMAPDEDPDSARLRGHYQSTREGAVGGFGGGGGGCGCN